MTELQVRDPVCPSATRSPRKPTSKLRLTVLAVWGRRSGKSWWMPRDGINLLFAAAVDVVLLDCILPGETTWQIVLEADRQNIPVVLMTGDADQMKDIGGPRPFILKPFTLHDLRSVIKEALRERKRGL